MPDRLTLEEAKAVIENRINVARLSTYGDESYLKGKLDAYDNCKAIMAIMEQPSEEDRAVLWLIREKGLTMARTGNGWMTQLRDRQDGHAYWLSINPTEEARKLGWGG